MMLRSSLLAVFVGLAFVAFGFSQDEKPEKSESRFTAVCSFQIVDHDGKPIVNTGFRIIKRGSRFTDENRTHDVFRADENGKFKIKFDPDEPVFPQGLIVETGSNRGVFTDIRLQSEGLLQLRLSKPRMLKFRIKGDRSVLQGKSLEVANGVYDKARRQYSMLLPYRLDEGGSLLMVDGVQNGWVALSIKGKGNLYWNPRIEFEEPEGEIIVDLNQLKEHQRKFRFVFEHNGTRVKPNGSVAFYVKTRESSGKKYEQTVKDGVAEVTGMYNIACWQLRLVDQGLVGYGIARIDSHSDFREKLIPIEELKPDQIQTLTIPVVPAGRIVGKVVTAEGVPFNGSLQCEARSLVGRNRTVFGIPQFMKIKDGKFEITPVPFDSEVKLKIGKFGNLTFSDFVITESDPDQIRTLTLPKTESTSIEVLMPNGEPAKKCSIRVCRKSDRNIKAVKLTRNTGLGVFDLALERKDDYLYRVRTPLGYQRILETEIVPGAKIKLKLKKGKRLSGNVVNQKNFAVSNMLIQALNDEEQIVDSAITDSKGNFQLTRLPDHPVRLKASHYSKKVNVEMTERIKPGLEKKVKLKALDERNLISA